MATITLQEVEQISESIAQFEGWMTEDELREYREEYNAWLEEQWAIEEVRQGIAF